MDCAILLRGLGTVLILVGLVLVYNPELVSNKAVPASTFEATERRIWWGLFIGIGTLLMFHHQWHPWQQTVAATFASLLFGLLVARLVGIALDGSVLKQWINVGIELVIMAPFIWWYFHARS
ncbi:DUF4345 family protein [Thalassotalea agarivorans]|uniref:DUF4345 domain-containing protein n=1 Tax=Thalassotalea agarivorans TaxID=349064 RepID=A0A1I0ENK7_THASX|nr:DUF4345 family protein [Thalassotalea agarivorans]SET46851.1 protein of unknown function [Thalassotalea agarivorans]